MKAIRTAIVGYGRSGRNIHTHLLRQLPDLYQIVAYVESDPERRAMIKAEMGIDATSQIESLLERDDLDLVVVASYSDHHAENSKTLLRKGLTVLSEKPAAKDEQAFESVVQTAREHDASYHVFQQYRFSPAYRQIKGVIASGKLGRIVQISLNYDNFARRWDWQTIHSRTAGSLLNTGPHPVDHALDLMGFPEDVSVVCKMDRAHTAGDGEDYVKMLLLAPGAPVADIEISSCNAYASDTFLVQGTRGTLHGTAKELAWQYYLEAENEPRPLIVTSLKNEKGEPIYCREKLVTHQETWQASEEDNNAKGLAFYRAYYQTLTEGAPFLVTLDQVKLQLQVIAKAHQQNAGLFT
ncbi:MAG: Gfo/Idh/MocA family oxidoreductase [Clostridiaceae bacterium]|jgi:predicted dehydrogenase|nr:Gfo/Idh/MocA family oxidoreductase [Clostridiaceae bacterium]